MITLSSRVGALLRAQVRDLPDYDPGADPDEVAAISGTAAVIKLSNNENPHGIAPAAAAAIARALDRGLGAYPDPAGRALRRAVADRHHIDIDQVILGNGSENILELLCLAYLDVGDLVLTQSPCFGLHEIFPKMMGARVRKIGSPHNFSVDLDAWRTALAEPTKMVFISNPSNPAGTFLTVHDLTALIEASSPTCLWVLDEAYFEYAINDPAYPDGLELLQSTQRTWIVLRTFSKAYGLAGLRVGYGIASEPDLLTPLNAVRTPYNVNQLAQEAALAALGDQAHLATTVGATVIERERVARLIDGAGLRRAPSAANFLFIDTGRSALDVVAALHKHGVIVKAWRESGYEAFIRMSIGHPADNDRCLAALFDICSREMPS